MDPTFIGVLDFERCLDGNHLRTEMNFMTFFAHPGGKFMRHPSVPQPSEEHGHPT